MEPRARPTEKWSTEQVLAAFAAVARPLFRRSYPANSCIASSRIAIEVARRFGIQAKPLAAQLWVRNDRLTKLLETTPDPTRDQVEEWKRMGAAGMTIGIGQPARFENGEWNRHLVAVVQGRWLVDASIDQGNEPGRLELPGVLIARLPQPITTGPWTRSYWLLDGTRIDYTFDPAERSYRVAPDWHPRPVADEVTEAVVGAMRSELAGHAAA